MLLYLFSLMQNTPFQIVLLLLGNKSIYWKVVGNQLFTTRKKCGTTTFLIKYILNKFLYFLSLSPTVPLYKSSQGSWEETNHNQDP